MTPHTIRLYGATTASSKIGTGFFFLINTWLIIDITGHASSAALSLIMTVLPGLLLSPAIGLMIDRGDPAKLAYRADLFRWAMLLAYAALYADGHATAASAYAISFLVALGNEVQVLSWRAALARHASADDMLRLNALTVVTGQTGQVLGAASSGIVLASIGAAATVCVAGATYLLAGVFGWLTARRLATAGHAAPLSRGEGKPKHYWRDLRAGVAHIVERPEIGFFYGLFVANMSVVFGMNAMLAPFVREELHLGAAAFGKIDAGYALGAIVGGFFVVRLANRFGRRKVLLLGVGIAAACLLAFSVCRGQVAAFAIYAGLGASFQSSVIALSTAQRATDSAYQGRVSASFNAINGLAGLVVYVIVAASAGHHVYRQLYLAQASALALLIPVVLLASRQRRIDLLLTPAPAVSMPASSLPASSN
ncbi:MFS transporter [Paraburkholderia bryophila]|uniref:MFS transporter n=1 Tax=Paraburkholderia bryophila TaxID=420952 RepID=UPI00234A3E0D|nr:MFS transporter [Paraburkholderia bryophila]WCM24224.1 MFS transporter [Paraburkholderia bryophila]